MSTRTLPELHFDPKPMSDTSLVCFFEYGSQYYGLAFHGGQVWINAQKKINWVAGTPMHVKCPLPYETQSKHRVKIHTRGYGEDPTALTYDTKGSPLMAATSFRMVRLLLKEAVRQCPSLSGHRKLELLREADAFEAFCDRFLEQVRSYKRGLARCKAARREDAGLPATEPRARDGELVRVVHPEHHRYADQHPTGTFRLEKTGKAYALRGIDGPHRGMLLRKSRGMLLARADAVPAEPAG